MLPLLLLVSNPRPPLPPLALGNEGTLNTIHPHLLWLRRGGPMLIRAVQHNSYSHPSPRVIPCLLKAAHPRLVALSLVLYTLLLGLLLFLLTPPKPQTLTNDYLFNHRHRE